MQINTLCAQDSKYRLPAPETGTEPPSISRRRSGHGALSAAAGIPAAFDPLVSRPLSTTSLHSCLFSQENVLLVPAAAYGAYPSLAAAQIEEPGLHSKRRILPRAAVWGVVWTPLHSSRRQDRMHREPNLTMQANRTSAFCSHSSPLLSPCLHPRHPSRRWVEDG
jgi:hypothetical protein